MSNPRASLREPLGVRDFEERRQLVQNPGMIGVEPRALLVRQQRLVDQPPVDRRERQRLEPMHGPFAALDRLRLAHEQKIFDADAEVALLVEAGLVGEDHARFERRAIGLVDAGRALVHREIAPDAVPGAVIVVEPRHPQRMARQHVDLRSAGALRKADARHADHALEHAREAVLHLRRRFADDDRAGDIRRAVEILPAGIDEENLVLLDRQVRGIIDAVMRDRRMRPGAGNRIERQILQLAARRAELRELRRRREFRLLALGRGHFEPAQEAHHGNTVAPMGEPRALLLDGVLARLHAARKGPCR